MHIKESDRAYRDVLGAVPTGVFVMAGCAAAGRPYGLTCNSYASVSLHPRLVTWSLAHNSRQFAAFTTNRYFSLNLLAADQEPLARTFASLVDDRFAGVRHAADRFGSPLLDGAAAWLSCETLHQHDGGDHVLFIAEVHEARKFDLAPLLFHRGAFTSLADAVTEPRSR